MSQPTQYPPSSDNSRFAPPSGNVPPKPSTPPPAGGNTGSSPGSQYGSSGAGNTYSSSPSYQSPVGSSPQYSPSAPSNTGYSAGQYSTPNSSSQTGMVLGIVSLVCIIVFPPASLVLGWIGYRISDRDNDSAGKVMSIIGAIAGGLLTLLFILIILFSFLVPLLFGLS